MEAVAYARRVEHTILRSFTISASNSSEAMSFFGLHRRRAIRLSMVPGTGALGGPDPGQAEPGIVEPGVAEEGSVLKSLRGDEGGGRSVGAGFDRLQRVPLSAGGSVAGRGRFFEQPFEPGSEKRQVRGISCRPLD